VLYKWVKTTSTWSYMGIDLIPDWVEREICS